MGTSDNLPRELDSRASGGIEVCLWWSPADDRTWVCVDDVRSGAVFVLPVADGNRARDVFDHPYAYATRRSVHSARVERLADCRQRAGVGGCLEHARAVDVDVAGGVGDEEEDRLGRRGDAPRRRDPIRRYRLGLRPAHGKGSTGRVRGSPKRGRMLMSGKKVTAAIWSPSRVSTISPAAWATGVCSSLR